MGMGGDGPRSSGVWRRVHHRRSGAVRTSNDGLHAIADEEGFSPHVYADVGGHRAIGYGHLLTPLDQRTHVTREQAFALLRRDVRVAERAVNRLVQVELNQNQFDALVSLVFNIGASAFERSTLLLLLNSGDYAGAADQFRVWRIGGGKVLDVLIRRRAREAERFRR